MSAYKITCSECGQRVHGWSKAEVREQFRAHVTTEHPDITEGEEKP